MENSHIHYKPSFHGDPKRGYKFWEYREEDTPPNFMIWDYKQPGHLVCSNHTKTGEHEYQCHGHDHGDHHIPSYHGNPSAGHEFYVYTNGAEIQNPEWDFHRIPCDNFIFLREEGPIFIYRCLGHHITYHGDPNRGHHFWKYDRNQKLDNFLKWDFVDDINFICSHHQHIGGNEYECLGHTKGDHLVPTYHGDPSRGYLFWVYPHGKELTNTQWDFRTPELCNNREHIGIVEGGLDEYRCHGHSQTFHGHPLRENQF
jgi:hypothetical protein